MREPEALFWAVVFPIVMSLALGRGVSCRGSAAGARRRGAGPAGRRGAAHARAPHRASWSATSQADEERAIREGDVHLVVVPTRPADLPLRFGARREPRRARSRRRRAEARSGTDRPVDRARGAAERAGVPLHRLADSGHPRHEHHEHRHVGHRVFDRAGAAAQAAEADGGEPDAEERVPAGAGDRAARVSGAGSRL